MGSGINCLPTCELFSEISAGLLSSVSELVDVSTFSEGATVNGGVPVGSRSGIAAIFKRGIAGAKISEFC